MRTRPTRPARHLALAVGLLLGAPALAACGGEDANTDVEGTAEQRLTALNERMDRLQDQIDELRDIADAATTTTAPEG